MATTPAPTQTHKSDLGRALKWVDFLKKYWGKILVVILVLWIGYSLLPTTGSVSATKKSGSSFREFVEDVNYSRTLELKAASFDPQQLCGVRPGKRVFGIPKIVYVLIEGTNFDLTSFIRVNGTLPGETFLVSDDGCVKISYALDGNARFAPQFIRIKFE